MSSIQDTQSVTLQYKFFCISFNIDKNTQTRLVIAVYIFYLGFEYESKQITTKTKKQL